MTVGLKPPMTGGGRAEFGSRSEMTGCIERLNWMVGSNFKPKQRKNNQIKFGVCIQIAHLR